MHRYDCEHETMIILANHSHIGWVREHYGQSAVFKNPRFF